MFSWLAQRSPVTEQKSFSLAHVCIKSVAEQQLFHRGRFVVLYILCDAHWKGQISRFMQIRCAFELQTVFAISLDNIRYFLQIPLQLSSTLSFNMSFIYYFNFNWRIKCAKERIDLHPPCSRNLFWDQQYANLVHRELRIIPEKSLLVYSNSLSMIIRFKF